MLKASGIRKTYPGTPEILQGVDLTLEPGKITCLIGPSGSGKTTLLKCLAMIDLATAGTIELDSELYTFPLPRGQKEVLPTPWPALTVVFQSLFLWPHLTLRENILLPARLVNPVAEQDIEGLIRVFEMEAFIDRFPNEASGGQKQRVALARALILNPKYILLDEITSALDIEQTARILTKLSHLKERGIGTLLITHHLGFARRAADQVVFMDQGKVIEAGPSSLLDNPGSARLREFLSVVELAA
jgi:ABC-type polar amino acid transport system ATPase subunit